MGTRLKDIIFDRHEDQLWQDEHAMSLTPYVMAERCLQVEMSNIYQDYKSGDYDTLTYILEGGFRGFHKYSKQELLDEWEEVEPKFWTLLDDDELPWEPYDEDPLSSLPKEVEGHPV